MYPSEVKLYRTALAILKNNGRKNECYYNHSKKRRRKTTNGIISDIIPLYEQFDVRHQF